MKRGFKKGISLFQALVMMASLFVGLPQVAFADSSWQMVGNDCFSAGNYFPISMALDSSDTPYVAFTDETQGWKCTVMKLDGGWVPVGDPGFTTSPALYPSLVIDGTGTPYVAYQDPSTNENKVSVMKFDNGNWVTVGNADFSAGKTESISLAVDSNGIPYVAYMDVANGNKATVMTLNQGTWVPVGGVEGFTTSKAESISLALNSNGTPYLAFKDYGDTVQANATVMRFDGTSWTHVGEASVSDSTVTLTSLALDSSGKPYVAYFDMGMGVEGISVKKWNGGNWVTVGNRGFTGQSQVNYVSLALDNSGTPYVAYQDDGNNHMGATVLKFDGNNWVVVGNKSFSTGEADFISLAVDSGGTLYAAYRDVVSDNDPNSPTYTRKTTVMKHEPAANAVKPAAPSVSADDGTNKIADADGTMEYSTDGGITWKDYDPNDEPTFLGDQPVDVRVKAAGGNPAGDAATLFFTENKYTITYDGNGSTGGTVPTDANSPYTSGTLVTVQDISTNGNIEKNGYSFDSWNTAVNGSGTKYLVNETFNIETNTTLYAQWRKIHTVTFKDFDDTVLRTRTVLDGDSLPTPMPPMRAGYTFTGWDKDYSNITADLVLTAQYTPDVIIPGAPTVSADDVNNKISNADGTMEYSTNGGANWTPYDPNNEPTFDGNQTVKVRVKTDGINPAGDETSITFTANTYTMSFDSQGGSAVGAESGITSGSTITPPGDPIQTGYTFAGWYKEAACTQAWNFGIDTVTADRTLYSKWTANIYNITYVLNSGTNDPANAVTYTYGVSMGLEAPTRTGYTFDGWYTVSNFSSSTVTSIGTTDTGSKTFYAKWSTSTFTVTYNSQGGSAVASEPSVTPGWGIDSPTDPTWTGHTFEGWHKDANCTDAWDFSSDVVTGNMTLYAKWTANSVKPAAPNVGKDDANNKLTGADGTMEYSTDGGITWKDYDPNNEPTFDGDQTVKVRVKTDGSNPAGDETSMTFAANTYTVTYDTQSGSAVSSQTNVSSGTTITAPTAPTKLGYTFGGWYKEAACTNAWNFATDTVTANTTLYAKWTELPSTTYTVTYDSQGGSAVSSQTSITSGATITAPKAPAKSGYTFGGWYKDAVCSNGNAWAFNTNTVTSNTTLYAKWEPIQQQQPVVYGVTYIANNVTAGVVPIDNSTYVAGSTMKVKGNTGSLAKAGYTFGGWSGGTNTYSAGQTYTVAGNVILMAVWNAVPATYTVTFNNNYFGGGTYTTLANVQVGSKITEPSAPGRTGYTFIGWYKDSACASPWDFANYAVASNTTLYAKWVSNTYDVGGSVEDVNNAKVSGATIKIMQGNIQFGNTETTDANGSFTVEDIPDGIYNLVVTKGNQEIVVYIIVSGTNYASGTITLPSGNKNSKLEILGAETPNIIVDGLNKVLNDATVYDNDDANTVSAGGTVEIKLAVQQNDQSTHKVVVEAAMRSNGFTSGAILDVDMTKTSISSNGVTENIPITQVTDPIKIIIPLTTELQGKSNYVVYRAHDYGSGVVVDAITTSAKANGEKIEISNDKTQLTVYLKFFSTYAIGYTTSAGSGSEGSDGSSGGSSSGSVNSGKTTSTSTGVDVLVNGKAEKAGTASQGTRGTQTLTNIVVDEKKLEQKMESEGNNAIITIPINTKADIVVGELSGQMVKDMEKKLDTLEVRTGNASYIIPAKQINIDAISKQVGSTVELKDIKIQVEIAKSTADTIKIVQGSAQKGSFSVVISPMDFRVKATYGGKTVDVSKFNVYVKRLVAIPDGVDPSKITTGIITEADGTSHHVPTEVTKIDGQYYAKINSLTNSTYTVVWHPMEFTDVANHWSKSVVNDMGSRMVVTGVGNGLYEPNRDITRAEFAAIVVRALGLKAGDGSNAFTDVGSNKWYCDYIKTATTYNIISGYGNGNFGPNDNITREQAMTMIARAMSITGLEANLTSADAEKLLVGFTDCSSASSYAKENIAKCVETGVVSGRGNNMVAPKENITRAEVAAIVSRLLQKSDLI